MPYEWLEALKSELCDPFHARSLRMRRFLSKETKTSADEQGSTDTEISE